MDIDECMICLEELKTNIAVLSCKHIIHYDCCINWAKEKKSLSELCPICDGRVEVINIIDHKNIDIIQKIEQKNLPIIGNTHDLEETNTKKWLCCSIL